MTGIGFGPIGENGIGGSTGGGIGVGGIGVGPIGGTAGHVSSSIGDSYRIERVNLPAVLGGTYDIAVSATVSDSYRVHVAPAIGSAYSIALASTLQAAHNIEVASRISDTYQICLAAVLEEQYDIIALFISHPSTIGDAWRISVSSPGGAVAGIPPTPYLYAQGFQISGLYAEQRAIAIKVYRQSHAMHTQGHETIDDVNAQDTIYVDPSRCRQDFRDIYFWDTVRQRAIPFWIQTSGAIAGHACYGATIILYEEAGTGTPGYYPCELRSGYDALPSQALTIAETGVTAGPAPHTQNAINGWGDPCATPWTLAPPVGLQYQPFGSYSIARASTISGQYSIFAIPQTPSSISDSYQIHLAKIMEG